MGKLIAGLVIGLIFGCLLTFFIFGGVPRAGKAPGSPIRPPDPAGSPAGTAQIVLKEEFFNHVLETIFRDMNPPAFPLGLAGNNDGSGPSNASSYGLIQTGPECASKITILPNGSGAQTGITFENDRISAPLAFSGSYNSMFGCLQFTGWAQAGMELRYDAAQQAVFGQLNVETVNLDGVNPVVSSFMTPIVQTTINNRVNPIQILRGEQIALNMPVAASGGNLMANVKDVRAEIKDKALNLYVSYEFNGQAAQ
jgi:hypothetical protein